MPFDHDSKGDSRNAQNSIGYPVRAGGRQHAGGRLRRRCAGHAGPGRAGSDRSRRAAEAPAEEATEAPAAAEEATAEPTEEAAAEAAATAEASETPVVLVAPAEVMEGRTPVRWYVGLGTGTDPAQIEMQQKVVEELQ